MRLSAARALLSVLILVVLGETTAGATPDEWLREWLRKLAVKIPPQTVRSTFVSVTLSDLTCTGFAVGTVSSELGARNEASVEVAVAGVGCECSGTWTIDSALSTEEAREFSSDGTAHEGLDEVTPEGVDTLAEFALKHNLDGTPAADGEKSANDQQRG